MIDCELVLLPGIDGSGILFEPIESRLSGVRRVTVVRYPADPRMRYDDYVKFVRAVIGNRRVVLLGESFSGPVAINVAAAVPEQIEGLILCATFLKSPWPGFLLKALASINLNYLPRGLRDFALIGVDGAPALADKVWSLVGAMEPGVIASRLRNVADIDVAPAFKGLKCPILALHGDSDWLISPKAIRPTLPQLQFERMPGPHMLLQTRPEQAANRILNFLQFLSR